MKNCWVRSLYLGHAGAKLLPTLGSLSRSKDWLTSIVNNHPCLFIYLSISWYLFIYFLIFICLFNDIYLSIYFLVFIYFLFIYLNTSNHKREFHVTHPNFTKLVNVVVIRSRTIESFCFSCGSSGGSKSKNNSSLWPAPERNISIHKIFILSFRSVMFIYNELAWKYASSWSSIDVRDVTLDAQVEDSVETVQERKALVGVVVTINPNVRRHSGLESCGCYCTKSK